MNKITKEDVKNLTDDQVCHLFALIAWNGKTFEEAKEIVLNKSNEELEPITWANGSITSAKNGIKKYASQLENGNYNRAVIEILSEIHDKWVVDNAKKYDRDKEKDDKRLFQHLPTAFIGLDELAKDMMFLSPYLEEKGLHIGDMPKESYGEFTPTSDIAKEYDAYVEDYKQVNAIDVLTSSDIQRIILNYPALQVESEFSDSRRKYMLERTEKLVNQVASKNSHFEADDEREI